MPEQRAFRLTEFYGSRSKRSLMHPPFRLHPAREHGNEFTVIIGPNGTGKSALLGALANDVGTVSEISDGGPSRTIAIANLVSDAFPIRSGTRGAAHQYQYLGLRQGTNTVTTGALTAASMAAILVLPMSPVPDFDWRSLGRELGMDEPILSARRVPNRPSPRPVIGESKWAEDRRLADELLSDAFERGEAFSQGVGQSESLTDALDNQGIAERLSQVVNELDGLFEVSELLRRLPYATGWRLQFEYERKPSAGQEVLFSQVLRIVSSARERALVLVDEPETALHPQWQSNFIPLVRDAVPDHLGMHILLATHSAFLVGEADSVVSASKQGFEQLDADFGALSIDAISYRAFGATTTGSVLVERDVSVVLEYLSDATTLALPGVSVVAAADRLHAQEDDGTVMLTQVLREYEEIVAARMEQTR